MQCLEVLKREFQHFSFYEQLKFHALMSLNMKKFYSLGTRMNFFLSLA